MFIKSAHNPIRMDIWIKSAHKPIRIDICFHIYVYTFQQHQIQNIICPDGNNIRGPEV